MMQNQNRMNSCFGPYQRAASSQQQANQQGRSSMSCQQLQSCGGASSAQAQNFSGGANRLSRQQLMKNIILYGFACVDASLYLDTHPDDVEALSYFKEHNRIYQEAVEEYSKTYGPLTIAHAHHCGAYWNWVDQPWPWQ